MRRLIAATALLLAVWPSRGFAQPVAEPIPKIVVDVQGMWGGVPSSEGWVPDVPDKTPIPNRAFGLGIGAHWLALRLGIATFGVGGSIIVSSSSKGDPSQVVVSGSGTTAVTGEATLPVVTTKVTSIVPQLSMSFGHRFGWSYLSAGYGSTRVDSRASALDELPATSAPDRWNPALNFGGGARWFMKRHLAASFDLRFVKLGSRAATDTAPFAKRAQVANLLVGISLQ